MEYCGCQGERRLRLNCSLNHWCCIIGKKNPVALQACLIPADPCHKKWNREKKNEGDSDVFELIMSFTMEQNSGCDLYSED